MRRASLFLRLISTQILAGAIVHNSIDILILSFAYNFYTMTITILHYNFDKCLSLAPRLLTAIASEYNIVEYVKTPLSYTLI